MQCFMDHISNHLYWCRSHSWFILIDKLNWTLRTENIGISTRIYFFTVNAELQWILFHEIVIVKDDCLIQLTQTDAVSVVQIVVEAVVEQYQLHFSMFVSTDKNYWHNNINTTTCTDIPTAPIGHSFLTAWPRSRLPVLSISNANSRGTKTLMHSVH